jgi:dienelactone hydrolase
MTHARLRPTLAALALLAFAAVARGEIQTLFRGECFTPAESAAKLAGFAATYETGDQWKARAAAIRAGVLRGMKLENLPPACDLKPIRRGKWAGDGYTVENVAFESLPGFWVTGNLYLPEKVDGKVPGILCPHGHGQDARLAEYTQTRAAAFARMGAIAFAYDMVGMGESIPVPHRHSETLRLQTYNGKRVIDFLVSQGNVDEGRLAITGESGGGTQSFVLACVDERLDVSAPVVMVSSYFYGGCMCESGMPIHKNGDHETNNVEIAAAFAPRPQLLVSVGGDWTAHMPDTDFPYIQRVYDLCGAKDAVENAHFADEQHDYGPSKRGAVYRFFAKQLKLDLSRVTDAEGKIDERWMKVRDRADLLVFPPDQPRPDYAVTSGEAVIGQLDRRR